MVSGDNKIDNYYYYYYYYCNLVCFEEDEQILYSDPIPRAIELFSDRRHVPRMDALSLDSVHIYYLGVLVHTK